MLVPSTWNVRDLPPRSTRVRTAFMWPLAFALGCDSACLAKIGFIHFDGRATAAHQYVKATLAQSFAKPVHHEPGRLVRNVQQAMDLVGRDAFLGGGQQESAPSHLVSGMLLRSKTVSTVTVNCSRHWLH